MFFHEILMELKSSIKEKSCRNAFCINERFFSYQQLGEYVSKVRLSLIEQEHYNNKIGLVINDDLETYASIIALWLEGFSYVPLHPNWPIERCLDICDQVELDLILDSSKHSRYVNLSVLNTTSLIYEKECLEPNDGVSDEELAYILFTSGSTGKPKGVQISRKNLSSFIDSFWQTGIVLRENDRCLQAFDLSFDVSVQSFLVALTRGACVYTIPPGQIKYIYASQLIDEHRITFGAMAPSMLRYLKPYFSEFDATSLKTCILTAEACPLGLIEDWFRCATNAELYDFYGPTECTIYCTYYKLVRNGYNKSLNGIISIGKPLANCEGIILDQAGDECGIGEKGELCISGDQVTPGYWKNPEKNEEAFFDKLVNGKFLRFYRTGDICYKDEDGDIMYSGRIDHQAKIQGFRVEMGEIEYHAREFLGGRNVVCLAFENKDALAEIAMFIESERFDTEEMITYMRTKMPAYMIPARLYFIPTFPLNNNEKIDKVKLKTMIE